MINKNRNQNNATRIKTRKDKKLNGNLLIAENNNNSILARSPHLSILTAAPNKAN